MAVFVNPKGKLIPDPERFGLEPGAVIIFGTAGDDTFIFNDGPFDHGVQHVVVGMGGADTFLAPNNLFEDRYYSGYLQDVRWAELGNGTPWRPHSDKPGWTHVGPNDQAKGINSVVTHGGHYGAGNEANVWIGPGSAAKVYVPGDEHYVKGSLKIGPIVKDAHGYHAEMSSLIIENDTPDNPITDAQRIELIFRNPKNGMDWHPTELHFAGPHPTTSDAQHFVDHFPGLV